MIDIDKEVRILAGNLYDGAFWASKDNPETNLYKYLKAFAVVFLYYKNYYNENIRELIIPKVEKYIIEYEKLLGIPDDIFTEVSNNLEERIKIVLVKLLGFLCRTREEVFNLLKILYPSITNIEVVYSGQEGSFGSYFPFPFYANPLQLNNKITYIITGIVDANVVIKILQSIHVFTLDISIIQN